MLATSTAAWLTAVFTGIAAIATTGYLIVTFRAHAHERAVSGTARPVIASRPRSSWTPDTHGLRPLLTDQTLVFGVHLLNRSHATESVTLEKCKLFWPYGRGSRFVAVNPPNALRDHGTLTVLLTRTKPWPKKVIKHCWISVGFESSGRKRFHLRGRVRVFRYHVNPSG